METTVYATSLVKMHNAPPSDAAGAEDAFCARAQLRLGHVVAGVTAAVAAFALYIGFLGMTGF